MKLIVLEHVKLDCILMKLEDLMLEDHLELKQQIAEWKGERQAMDYVLGRTIEQLKKDAQQKFKKLKEKKCSSLWEHFLIILGVEEVGAYFLF